MSDRGEFALIIGMLEAAFGAQPVPRHEVYFELLREYSIEALKAAALRCIRECKAYPPVHDLLERVPGYTSPKAASKLAWAKVMKAVDEGPFSFDPVNGSWPTGENLDDFTFHVVGGIAGLTRILRISDDAKALSFAERDFCDRYEALSNNQAAQHSLAPTGRESQARIKAGEPRQLGAIIAATLAGVRE